jgi:hypothetical protein
LFAPVYRAEIRGTVVGIFIRCFPATRDIAGRPEVFNFDYTSTEFREELANARPRQHGREFQDNKIFELTHGDFDQKRNDVPNCKSFLAFLCFLIT